MEQHSERILILTSSHYVSYFSHRKACRVSCHHKLLLLSLLGSIIFLGPKMFLHALTFLFFFLAALGLRCCARAFSSCGEPGLLFTVARGLLIALASLVAEHGL